MTDKSTQLDQFLSIAKTLSNVESVVEMIQKVIESPFVYSFSDFLELPFFQAVISKNNINFLLKSNNLSLKTTRLILSITICWNYFLMGHFLSINVIIFFAK